MNLKYTVKDAGKQKFVIGNYYRWGMTDDKDVKAQINEYHKLFEKLKVVNISLPDKFVASLLIKIYQNLEGTINNNLNISKNNSLLWI